MMIRPHSLPGRRRIGDRQPCPGGAVALAILIVVGVGCGTDGAAQFGGEAPTAEAVFGDCAFCHAPVAQRMVETGGHHDLDLKCQFCHENLMPGEVGPGHRSIPACRDCHVEEQTHQDPAAGTKQECLVCHTPHGSTNIFLIREQILTARNEVEPIEFTNLLGLAEGSFASPTDPGSGLCEVCHTQTRYYRHDGSGQEHFPFACITCHPHAGGFRPR